MIKTLPFLHRTVEKTVEENVEKNLNSIYQSSTYDMNEY